MFRYLSDLVLTSNDRKLTPIIGGDINCRFGSLGDVFRGQGLAYSENADTTSNYHGRTYGADLCNTGDVFPVNHLHYKQKIFNGDFTYIKGNKKSQIDFVFTNREGLKRIRELTIPTENWHLSDHRPILLEIDAPDSIQTSGLLRRAKDLNYEFDPHYSIPTRYLSTYNTHIFEATLKEMFPVIEEKLCKELRNENINGAIGKFDEEIAKVYRAAKVKFVPKDDASYDLMKKANEHFDNLHKCISGEMAGDIDDLTKKYQDARKMITQDICSNNHKRWKELTSDTDCKRLWKKINWKGEMGSVPTKSPVFEDLKLFFEKLYENGEDDLKKIEELTTDEYVPSLDNPITMQEMKDASGLMKNGGFDHKSDKFKIIVNTMSPLILLLLNILFYVAYPVNLAVSLLAALPKKGDLSLPKNYRGIQMIKALAVLFDRVITKRIESWIGVSDEQTAFQRLKSTLYHIFTIRLLIETAKKKKIKLYIAFFDLEKAFDKVSRYKLLKKLIKMGIGSCMLRALKRLYIRTFCILVYGKEYSDKFRTYSGIRQGAASSALLFIAFIDDLVDYLKERCPPEDMLDLLHCLLHADDTAILSTDRDLFVDKCNHMLDYFDENSLSLNLGKSGYMIINGHKNEKVNLLLKNGLLEYNSVMKYLGVKISDTGDIKFDIDLFVAEKRANVTIKYGNFCRKNLLAPLDIKTQVLNTCVSASLLYSCETWGASIFKNIEVLYRQGLKTAMSVRKSVNNEIVYVESGEYPLQIRIVRQQLKFWITLQDYLAQNPQHYLQKLIDQADNVTYMNYYSELQRRYTDPASCEEMMKNELQAANEEAIRTAFTTDENSKLGTYLRVNPTLVKPSYDNKLEFQRILITRYRTGSHNLAIEKGRFSGITREQRLCSCNTDIQTIDHVILHCPLLADVRARCGITDVETGVMDDKFLVEMEMLLGVK